MSDLQKYESNAPETSQSMAPVNKDVLDQMMAYGQAWSQAAMLGDQLAKTDFAGPFKGKPADMTVAILKGANLGIPPTDIGKAIYVVHGTPALYGKTALAIALQHGYIAETIEDSPTAVTVRMTSPQGQSMDVRYTIERATTEGLVKGNKLQYETRPSKMLYWKCIGELTDRMIPHLTGGMPVKEDVEQSPVQATATRMDVSRGAEGVRAALAAKQQPQPEPDLDLESAHNPVDDYINEVTEHLATLDTQDEVNAFMANLQEQDDNLPEGVIRAGRARWKELDNA